MMKPSKARNAPPRASAMLEALRGLGYSPATALADIIDNSITAGATRVDVTFYWRGNQSAITILDNGVGMTDGALYSAMKLGGRSPLEERSSHDLGRFGLGLKTASFSQCRRLTVSSKSNGITSCLRWDLDTLAAQADDGWFMLEGAADGSEELLSSLEGYPHGTIVAWEVLDRLVTEGFTEQDFLDLVDRIERHLSMTFHRFLTGVSPRLQLYLNSRTVQPWDPFLTSHPATWSSPVANLKSGDSAIDVQCFVLPHQDKLDNRQYEFAAGPDGWTAQQGFYVYRNERLLVAGSWLGLGRGRSWTKEEAHKLARIRLDIPNSVDRDWKIDVRKSIARPPVSVKEQLTLLAEDTRSRARRVFAHRGQPIRSMDGKQILQAWRIERFKGGVRYRVDTEHPAVKNVIDDFPNIAPQIQTMLRVIEETIPVQRIWLDTAEAREVPRTGFSGQPPSELLNVLSVMFRNMIERKGMSATAAKSLLLRTEPFDRYPELVCAMTDEPTP
jgi:hypothetical protein